MKHSLLLILSLIFLVVIISDSCSAQNRVQSNFDSVLCAHRIDRMVRRAISYIGTPYKWGASGPNYFDCSGFIYHLYYEIGVQINNTKPNAQRLSELGESVELTGIKKGDLIFFTENSKSTNITHVGMAISDCKDGNFKFIHSNISDGGVSVSEFEPYQQHRKTYSCARRISPCL